MEDGHGVLVFVGGAEGKTVLDSVSASYYVALFGIILDDETHPSLVSFLNEEVRGCRFATKNHARFAGISREMPLQHLVYLI